jgi:hypothetical protein
MTSTPENHVQGGPISAHSQVVQNGEPVEVQEIAGLFRGLVEPIAKSQEFAESEKTKRSQIEADTTKTFLKYSFLLAAAVLVISVIALLLGKDQLTEKIIFAVFGFIGGFAFAKSAKNEKS